MSTPAVRTSPSATTPPSAVESRLLLIARIGSAALLALLGAGVLFPQARLWAFHFLAYYPLWAQALFAAGALATLGLARRRLPTAPVAHPAAEPLLVAIAGGLFFLFPAATALMGDGQLWTNELYAGASDYGTVRAPLTMLLLHSVYDVVKPLGMEPPALYHVVAALAGIACVLAWLYLSRILRIGTGPALILGAAWGGVLLFFGYVETYAPAMAVLTWMLVLMLAAVRRGRPSWLPVALGLLAPFLNFIGVLFWPALAGYAWWWITRRELRPRPVILASGVVLVVATGLYFALGWHRGTNVLLPLLTAGGNGYAVLTARHLVNLLNSLLLVAGPLILLAGTAALSGRLRSLRWNTGWLLLALALSFPLIALVMHNPQLGMARDFDIAAALLLAVPVAALFLWEQLALAIPVARGVLALTAAWTVLAIAPAIGVQASEPLTVRRFQDLLTLDPDRSETGWDYLSSYYLLKEDLEGWARANQELLKRSENPRYHSSLAFYYGMKGDWGQAHAHARAVGRAIYADSTVTEWEEKVSDPGPLLQFGRAVLERSQAQDALQIYTAAAELAPYSPWPRVALADLFVRVRNLERAQAELSQLVRWDSSGIAPARRLFQSQTEKTASAYQAASGWLGLSLLSAAAGDTVAAQDAGDKALTRVPGDTLLVRWSRMLRQAP